jgi:copper homeostasis protein CutC
MFVKKGEFYTNKDEEFLKSSDLVVYWNTKPKKLIKNYVVLGGEDEHSKVDIRRADKDLALLMSRLALVFRVFDERLEDSEEFEEFSDILKGVRVKTQIKKHLTTLEEVSGVLYLMDNSEKISIIVGKTDREEFEVLMNFLVMMGFFSDKIGVFSKEDISWYKEFYFYE